MKKIAILIALSMMLAGCTELEEIIDNLDATYTTQDLDGTYYGMMLSMRVAMNADETFDIYLLEMKGCYGSASEAQEVADEMNQMAASDDEDDEESSSSISTHIIIDGDCVAEEGLLVEEDGTSFTATLESTSAIPTLSVIISESGEFFVCDDGYQVDSDWVNDGYDDCDGGEDEVEGAEDDIQTMTVDVAHAYLAADGYGTLALSEMDESICLALSPTGMYDLIDEAVDILEEAAEDGAEIDIEDESTFPEDVIALFAVHEVSYALSPASTLAESCEGQSFLSSTLLFWIWASSLAEGNTDGEFMLYDFDVIDASSETPTSTAGEDLVYVTMNQGNDLNWAEIIVQLSVNGGAFIQCTQPGQSADTSCHVTDNGDAYWGLGEAVDISEGSDDLCSGPCDVQIKILNAVENKLIYESTTIYVE
ncbi:MAG: hypothetical protein CMA18_005580 [Methanobacteriota archaeon]|nr:MAG: hypothetical protein CBC63_02530 [Euryarchaeota archaeon TMED103]RAH10375.1 MAG: hypothetical protein CMA18_005580 [Euryarchaeota archaeon]